MPQFERLERLRRQVAALAADVDEAVRNARENAAEKADYARACRIARKDRFPADYFADPAWDILLDLRRAAVDGAGMPATHIGLEMGIPLSTVLRHLKRMEEDGYVSRETDAKDSRRSIARLTDKGMAAIDKTFDPDSSAKWRRKVR